TVLWWGPEAEAASPPVVWDQAESAALTAGGARLLEPEALAALQVEAGIAGMAAARTVVAVLPGRRLEEPARPSSLLARLETAAGRSQEDRLTPESLVDGGRWSLAGRSLAVRTPTEEHPRPDTSASRSAGALTPLAPSRASARPPAATDADRWQEARLTPERLWDGGRCSLAARSLAVRPPTEEHPRPDTSASRSAGDLPHLLPSRVSYSQLDTLIACPHRWVLEHAL